MEKNRCIECDKLISQGHLRCQSCAATGRVISSETRAKISATLKKIKTKKLWRCLDCGKIIKWGSTRCTPCSFRKRKGRKMSENQKRKISIKVSGPANGNWKGGRFKNGSGYILIWTPDHPYANTRGYMREHRLVIENILGRKLNRTELVHHINQNRCDNREENLKIMGRPEHTAYHRKRHEKTD